MQEADEAPFDDGGVAADCPEQARFVYYLTWSAPSTELVLRRFEPATNRVEPVAPFACDPAAGVPMALTVDRHGHGWTLLRSEADLESPLELRGVDLLSGRCDATGVRLDLPPDRATMTASLVRIATGADAEETIYLLAQDVVLARLYRVDPSTGALAELGMVSFLDFASLTASGGGQLFVLDSFSSSGAGIATLDPRSCRSTPLVSLQEMVDALWITRDGTHGRYVSQGFVAWGDSFYLFVSPADSTTSTIFRVTASGAWEAVVEDAGGVSLGAGLSSCAPYELF